jgi:SsrA-binding protein
MTGIMPLAKNKKAFFNYTVLESLECGMVLQGSEVKSIRGGMFSFPDSFAEVKGGEVWARGVHIS